MVGVGFRFQPEFPETVNATLRSKVTLKTSSKWRVKKLKAFLTNENKI